MADRGQRVVGVAERPVRRQLDRAGFSVGQYRSVGEIMVENVGFVEKSAFGEAAGGIVCALGGRRTLALWLYA
jgi:hypothetical protein